MSNVWKIGSRWGNCGERVLDLFIDYGCVFFGEAYKPHIGNWRAVKPNDLFIVSDGGTPVAIAMALTTFQTYDELGIKFSGCDKSDFIDGCDVVVCKVSIELLSENACKEDWGIDIQKRFCHHKTSKKVIDYWASCQRSLQKGSFDIKSDTWQLLDTPSHKGLISPSIRYRIPIYQRPYSWGGNELMHLVEDLNQAVRNAEPVFMGTMQLGQAIPLNPQGTQKAYDLIDGQQRITTFIIILSILQNRIDKTVDIDFSHNLRTIVNRGEAQRDLEEFWEQIASSGNTQDNRNPYIRNSAIINSLLNEYFDGKDENPSLSQLWDFLLTNIRFVVIETRAGLSKTLKIFNTINTAGLDLGAEDLFKVRFFEYRKWCGDNDEVFDRISDVYAAIEVYKREHPENGLSMGNILSTYQRILVVKCNLSMATYDMSYERFFEMLFDTSLGIHIWPEFKTCIGQKNQLTIGDLTMLIDCFKARYQCESTNCDFRIMNAMLWDTRYGDTWNFSIIALFFQKITTDQLCEFTTNLFKLLVPASLYFAKRIYAINSALFSLLKKIPESNDGITILNEYLKSGFWGGQKMMDQMEKACTWQISSYPKWKMLICRLAEYLKNDKKDEALFAKLFRTAVDIEHIQCYTDENDRELVWNEWGEELNRLGNLTIFEQSLNRSIRNDRKKKPEAYSQSCYVSVQELKNEVATWNKPQAEKRRMEITRLLCNYLSMNV